MKIFHNNISPSRTVKTAVLLAMGATMWSCQSDLPDSGYDPADGIAFRGTVLENLNVGTRALQTKYLATDPYDMDFYIEMLYEKPGEASTTTIGTYRVPDGYEGRLNTKAGNEPLNWQDLKSDHTFWTWNEPWQGNPNYNPTYENPADEGSPAPNTNPLHLTFYDSGEGTAYDTYRNNDVYETFIGTKAGPVNYADHGQYVELTYKHLVSKIQIEKLTLLLSDNSIQNDLIGEITFLGMPKEATFFPHPADGGAPIVETKFDDSSQLTYYIKSAATAYDYIYVCPEIDFRNLGFYINITDERWANYGDHGNYYGDFRNVKFERLDADGNPVDWDSPDGGDDTVLHAGEMMTLHIILHPGIGPGVTLTIQPWNTERSGDANHHSHSGIYTDGEAAQLAAGGDMESLSELFGAKDEDDNDVFYIYDNVSINSSNFKNGPDYPVDGKGHLLTMTSSNNNVKTGPMRDIYITDGKNTVYIDSEGNIFRVVNGELIATPYRLDPLAGNNICYQINLATGQVTPQTKF